MIYVCCLIILLTIKWRIHLKRIAKDLDSVQVVSGQGKRAGIYQFYKRK